MGIDWKNNLTNERRILSHKSLNFLKIGMPKSYDVAFDEYYFRYS